MHKHCKGPSLPFTLTLQTLTVSQLSLKNYTLNYKIMQKYRYNVVKGFIMSYCYLNQSTQVSQIYLIYSNGSFADGIKWYWNLCQQIKKYKSVIKIYGIRS
jgi:hypothetical protein